MRKLTSFYKIQKVISAIKRFSNLGNSYDKSKQYMDLGCGDNINQSFINIDYHWMPGIDVCMDISQMNLPISSDYLKGIFTEHCLEHLPYQEIPRILSEFYRVLKTNGILRIIVPDGQIYLEEYNKSLKGQPVNMPFYEGYKTPIERVNGIFRNHGHLFIYDFETFKLLLKEAGFKKIIKCSFNVGIDENLLKDTEWRSVESLYIEAIK